MPRTSDPQQSSIIDELKTTLNDAVDYASSALNLLSARVAELALSSMVVGLLLLGAGLLVLASFVILNIALGVWLTHLYNSALVSLLILGGFYAILAVIAGGIAMRWIHRLKS